MTSDTGDAISTADVGTGVLPSTLTLGPVHLVVTDLERSVEWYRRSLGLHVGAYGDGSAELGDGSEVVVVLEEDTEAMTAGRHAGLYHYALLYPTRKALALAALRLVATRTPIQGASDHHTHEAIYLPDPDGNGIELAADRPREQWPTKLDFSGGPQPLDVNDLLSTTHGEEPPLQITEGVRIGHVHLHVGDVDSALAFYRDLIGFDEQMRLDSAAFVSVGGYHHHLGLNTWRGGGVDPAPAHVVGLRHWTVQLPRPEDVEHVRARLEAADVHVSEQARGFLVRDPWTIALLVEARQAPHNT